MEGYFPCLYVYIQVEIKKEIEEYFINAVRQSKGLLDVKFVI